MTKRMSKLDSPDLVAAFHAVKRHFIYAGAFSAAVNILLLVPIIYMLQVYDRVMASGSYSTLIMLTVLMMALLMAMGGFEWVRSRILVAASNKLDAELRERIVNITFKLALLNPGSRSSAQPVNDLNGLRQFLTGNGIFAFFDAPWFPIYLAVMFMFHFWFGVMGIIAAVIMVALAWTNEKMTNKRMQDANSEANQINARLVSSLRNAEVIEAMGMTKDIREGMQRYNARVMALQSEASNLAGGLTALSKSFRMIMQSLTLGLGALLALQHEISAGAVIAGSLLLGRALAPIDIMVGTWKGFSVARAQYERLSDMFAQIPPEQERMRLPPPQGNLMLDQIIVAPPGTRIPVLRGISLQLAPGQVLGVIGPSASGKSTLARAILGIWPAQSGKVRLDGADISAWDRTELGPYLGYLPQDIELFDGNIADNICRFGEANPDKIVAAAKLAGVHELILRQPDGYDTIIGGSGGMLSGGQRQRIGLARAIYGEPKLLVLDEPNSNLDDQGEKELVAAISRIKSTGCAIVIISHRTMILAGVDSILVLKEGAAAAYGPRDQVMGMLGQPNPRRSAADAA
jgi:ATP-binding cassette, subfamily C, bacterial EexD